MLAANAVFLWEYEMKNRFKKLFSVFFVFSVICAGVFAAPIKIENGYKDLAWGTTVKDAQKKGYKLSLLTGEDVNILQAKFSEKVDFYHVKTNEKNLNLLVFCYYKEKLFCVCESLEGKNFSIQTLKSRYGENILSSGSSDGAFFAFGADNNLTASFIMDGTTRILTFIFDWNIFGKLTGQITDGSNSANSSDSTNSSDFVKQFDGLAQKLLQEPKKGEKASYAFLDFSTDNQNSSVEKYITDALTESVFNTGKVKIIERDNLEKILNEQKLQSSGLVNESQAANIGNIAGVEYVCYGTIKEIENGYTVSARVVDVESGEICAMSRTNITKDSYLEGVASGNSGSSKKSSSSAAAKKPQNSLWVCQTSRNEFDGYTTYIFTLKGPQNEFLFMGYDKNDVPSKSLVRAGVNWGGMSYGTYDFKTETKGTVSKRFNNAKWSKDTGWKDGSNWFYFSYNKGESARFFINLFEDNNYLTIRHDGNVRRFQTMGFWETVEANGLTKQEIFDAIGNEEF